MYTEVECCHLTNCIEFRRILGERHHAVDKQESVANDSSAECHYDPLERVNSEHEDAECEVLSQIKIEPGDHTELCRYADSDDFTQRHGASENVFLSEKHEGYKSEFKTYGYEDVGNEMRTDQNHRLSMSDSFCPLPTRRMDTDKTYITFGLNPKFGEDLIKTEIVEEGELNSTHTDIADACKSMEMEVNDISTECKSLKMEVNGIKTEYKDIKIEADEVKTECLGMKMGVNDIKTKGNPAFAECEDMIYSSGQRPATLRTVPVLLVKNAVQDLFHHERALDGRPLAFVPNDVTAVPYSYNYQNSLFAGIPPLIYYQPPGCQGDWYLNIRQNSTYGALVDEPLYFNSFNHLAASQIPFPCPTIPNSVCSSVERFPMEIDKQTTARVSADLACGINDTGPCYGGKIEERAHGQTYADLTNNPRRSDTKATEQTESKTRQPKHYECIICHSCFACKSYLRRHEAEVHHVGKKPTPRIRHDVIDYDTLRCHQHGRVFPDKAALTKHYKYVHRRRLKHECEHCWHACKSEKELLLHNARKHGMGITSDKYPILRCTYEGCSFATLLSGRLNMHINSSHIVERSECGLCGHTFIRPETLPKHQRRIHKEYVCAKKKKSKKKKMKADTPIPCEQCDVVLKNECTYKNHIQRVHSEKRRYLCTKCPYITTTKRSFSNHMYEKHGENEVNVQRYKCELCGVKIATKGKYDEHMDRHSGVPRYRCEVCNKGFVTKRAAYVHFKWHHQTGHTELACTRAGCTFVCTSKTTLKRHVEGVHASIKAFQCHVCSYTTNIRGNLVKHLRLVHEIEVQTRALLNPFITIKNQVPKDRVKGFVKIDSKGKVIPLSQEELTDKNDYKPNRNGQIHSTVSPADTRNNEDATYIMSSQTMSSASSVCDGEDEFTSGALSSPDEAEFTPTSELWNEKLFL